MKINKFKPINYLVFTYYYHVFSSPGDNIPMIFP